MYGEVAPVASPAFRQRKSTLGGPFWPPPVGGLLPLVGHVLDRHRRHAELLGNRPDAGPAGLGLFVPANTPRAIVDQLYRETEKALRTPGVTDKFKPQGIEPMPMTSAEFDALIKKEIDTNIALVKAANLKFN